MIDGEAALANYRALATHRRARPLWLLRGRGLHARAGSRRASHACIVRAYMAHHQGMSIVAIANALLDGRMRERFHSDVAVQATELLLQERTPRDVSVAHPRAEEVGTAARIADPQVPEVRRLTSPHDSAPQTHLLSNGRYSVMITRRGLRLQPLERSRRSRAGAKTRRATTPAASSCCATSTAAACGRRATSPARSSPVRYEVSFTEDRAEIIRGDGDLVTTLEVQVSPEDDAEVRRLSHQQCLGSARARSKSPRTPNWCSAPRRRTWRIRRSRRCSCAPSSSPRHGVLLANRRRRAPDEPEIWASHHAVIEGVHGAAPEFETDRARFIGRGRELRAPLAMLGGPRAVGHRRHGAGRGVRAALPGERSGRWHGAHRVLDLRGAEPRAGAGTGRQAPRSQRAYARRHARLDAGAGAAAASRHRRLAGQSVPATRRPRSCSPTPPRVARPTPSGAARPGPQALWSQGISGDLPIVLMRIEETDDLPVVRQLLQAHEYWGIKRLSVDLVILNERGASYVQDLQIALESHGAHRPGAAAHRRRGQRAARCSCCAAIWIDRRDAARCCWPWRAWCCRAGAAVSPTRWNACSPCPSRPAPAAARAAAGAGSAGRDAEAARELEFFNGLGGFAAQGREYVITAPAAADAGAVDQRDRQSAASASTCPPTARGFTWARNSRENALTPVEQRSGHRPARRGYLPARRRDRRVVEPHAGADPPSSRRTTPARHGFGYSALPAALARRGAGTHAAWSRRDDPAKICRLRGTQRVSRARAACR